MLQVSCFSDSILMQEVPLQCRIIISHFGLRSQDSQSVFDASNQKKAR